MSTHLGGFSPNATVIVLVLVFDLAHYLFASLSAHPQPCCPVILAVGKGICGTNGTTVYPAGAVYRYHGLSDAVRNRFWGDIYRLWLCEIKRLPSSGAIFGVIYISTSLLVGWPILAMWNYTFAKR
ncbi:anion permease [Shigella flexneri]